MCLQCVTECEYYYWPDGSRFLPGFTLIRATKEAPGEMAIGDWGLVECNDPSIIFKITPTLDSSLIHDAFEAFRDELKCDPDTGHRLYTDFMDTKPSFTLKRLYVKNCAYWSSKQLYVALAYFISIAEVSKE